VADVKTVFMFSGQGSQFFHMGKDLFDNDTTFRGWMMRLDEIARQSTGRSVIEAVYDSTRSKSDPFDRTLLTHPALFMVEYSLAETLIEMGVMPDKVLGASAGSFAAAAVAGMIGFEDAMRAVVRQAMAFEQACDPGGMMAIMADPKLFREESLNDYGELAAINFDTHFVVSAPRERLTAIEQKLKQRNIAYQRLPVSFAFHSRWIDRAKDSFDAFVRCIRCSGGRTPLVCCEQAASLSAPTHDFFWNVVRYPIRFFEAAQRLEAEGPHHYVDVGPAGTLATFLKYGLPRSSKSTRHAVLTPFASDRKNLAALAALATQ